MRVINYFLSTNAASSCVSDNNQIPSHDYIMFSLQ